MTMEIDRWTTDFKIVTGDVQARTAMFVGCSSGVEGNVFTGAVGRTWEKCVGHARQHTIGDNAQCYGIIMFQLNVASVVAGGEVMNGLSSLLSPEHTVTIPLSDYTFTDTVTARGVNCGGGSATPRADGQFVIYIGLYGNRGEPRTSACAAPPRRTAWQQQQPSGRGRKPEGQDVEVQGTQDVHGVRQSRPL